MAVVPTCPNCWAVNREQWGLQWTSDIPGEVGYYRCSNCCSQFLPYNLNNLKEIPKMEDTDGIWAIIRPDSQSGHSPSRRFKTEKEAIAAAKELAESNITKVFEVVRVTNRVSCRPKARVVSVR